MPRVIGVKAQYTPITIPAVEGGTTLLRPDWDCCLPRETALCYSDCDGIPDDIYISRPGTEPAIYAGSYAWKTFKLSKVQRWDGEFTWKFSEGEQSGLRDMAWDWIGTTTPQRVEDCYLEWKFFPLDCSGHFGIRWFDHLGQAQQGNQNWPLESNFISFGNGFSPLTLVFDYRHDTHTCDPLIGYYHWAFSGEQPPTVGVMPLVMSANIGPPEPSIAPFTGETCAAKLHVTLTEQGGLSRVDSVTQTQYDSFGNLIPSERWKFADSIDLDIELVRPRGYCCWYWDGNIQGCPARAIVCNNYVGDYEFYLQTGTALDFSLLTDISGIHRIGSKYATASFRRPITTVQGGASGESWLVHPNRFPYAVHNQVYKCNYTIEEI